MIYELWETRSGNLAGAFDDEASALRAVRDAAHRHGRSYVDSFALVRENSRGRATTIAEGAALADLALSTGGGEPGPSGTAGDWPRPIGEYSGFRISGHPDTSASFRMDVLGPAPAGGNERVFSLVVTFSDLPAPPAPYWPADEQVISAVITAGMPEVRRLLESGQYTRGQIYRRRSRWRWGRPAATG